MKTSYFYSKKLKPEHDLVSVEYFIPDDIKEKFPNIRSYDKLKPTKKMFFYNHRSKKITKDEYKKIYIDQVLSKLDPYKVYKDLEKSVILGVEPPWRFSHVQLIVKWLSENLKNVKIKEL